MGDQLRIREATVADTPALGRIGWRAFRDGNAEGWTSYFVENPHATPDAVLLAETSDGAIAGHATALKLTMTLAGVDVPMRGMAAVAVAPEHRRRGVADRLMRAHLQRMRKRGDALSLLYPFRQSFYRKFGWEMCEWFDHLRAAPAQLPASPLRAHVRALDLERHGAAVMALYARVRATTITTGLLARNEYWWSQRVWKRAGEGAVYVDPETRAIDGALLFEVPAEPKYPRQHLIVRDITSATPAAFRALVGFLAALGEQYAVVQLPLPRGSGAALLLDRPDLPLGPNFGMLEPAAFLTVGAMARLVDIPAAFALHPGPARAAVRGKLGLDVDDPIFPKHHRALDVTFGARGATVTPGATARDRLGLDVGRLAQIYFAAAPASLLLSQGLIEGSARAAALLDAAFAGPPLYHGPGNFY